MGDDQPGAVDTGQTNRADAAAAMIAAMLDNAQLRAVGTDETKGTSTAKIAIAVAIITVVGSIVVGFITGFFQVQVAKITSSPPAVASQTSIPMDQASGGTRPPTSTTHAKSRTSRSIRLPYRNPIEIGGGTAVDLDSGKTGTVDAPPAGVDLIENAGFLKPEKGNLLFRDVSNGDRCRENLKANEGGVGQRDVKNERKGHVMCLTTDEGHIAILEVETQTDDAEVKPLELKVRLEKSGA